MQPRHVFAGAAPSAAAGGDGTDAGRRPLRPQALAAESTPGRHFRAKPGAGLARGRAALRGLSGMSDLRSEHDREGFSFREGFSCLAAENSTSGDKSSRCCPVPFPGISCYLPVFWAKRNGCRLARRGPARSWSGSAAAGEEGAFRCVLGEGDRLVVGGPCLVFAA